MSDITPRDALAEVLDGDQSEYRKAAEAAKRAGLSETPFTADTIGLTREEFKILHAALHDPGDPLHSAMTSNGARSVVYGLRSAVEQVIAARMTHAAARAWGDGWASGVADAACWDRGEDVPATRNPYHAEVTP